MDQATRRKHGVTIFIIFLIPLLVISNVSLLIMDRVNANHDEYPVMKNDFSVAGIPLENLTRTEAISILEEEIATIHQDQITIQFQDKEWIIAVSELQLTFDIPATVEEAFSLTSRSSRQHIPLVMQYDRARLQEIIAGIADEVNIPAIDASVYKAGNRVERSSEQVGYVLHVDNLVLSIQHAIANGLPNNHFTISLTEVIPRISNNDLREIDRHFVTFSTKVSEKDTNRAHNIEHAVARIQHFISAPQTIVSFDDLAGPYSADQGYIEAPLLRNGMATDSYGGGVCQVSSTLFVAAMKAGFDLEEHYHHERPVPYIPLGYDATVIEDTEDLKLVNNKRNNMYVSLAFLDGEVQVDIYGNKDDYTAYSLETRNKKSIAPTIVYHLDTSLTPYAEHLVSNGEQGYTVDLHRIWRAENQQHELLASFQYDSIPKVYHIGERHFNADKAPESKGR